ncbi:CPBP family intramembrane metalloprotease [Candidatus Saccharibacteria bacterium]|nr:CPBP family intramembrane metalloprotease [Candidatus Saccharibacteria bacterium]
MKPSLNQNNKQSSKPNTRMSYNPFITIVLTVSVYIVAQIAAVLAISLIFFVFGMSADDAEAWITNGSIGTFVLYAVVSSVIFILIRKILKRQNVSWGDIGFDGFKAEYVLKSFLAYIAYLAALFVVVGVVSALLPGLDTRQKQQLGFDSQTQSHYLILVFMSLVILPPLIEETLMRGFMFTNLRNKLHFLPATMLTSIVFAAAHLQLGSGAKLLWIAALDTLILSLFLCYLREKSDSLWPCILLHGIKNTVAFLFLFVFA